MYQKNVRIHFPPNMAVVLGNQQQTQKHLNIQCPNYWGDQ